MAQPVPENPCCRPDSVSVPGEALGQALAAEALWQEFWQRSGRE